MSENLNGNVAVETFQSPLRRGTSADGSVPVVPAALVVSIPSSSGHVRGRAGRLRALRPPARVSFPSSSGHVRGPERLPAGPPPPRPASFNPLFVGARPRTGTYVAEPIIP